LRVNYKGDDTDDKEVVMGDWVYHSKYGEATVTVEQSNHHSLSNPGGHNANGTAIGNDSDAGGKALDEKTESQIPILEGDNAISGGRKAAIIKPFHVQDN